MNMRYRYEQSHRVYEEDELAYNRAYYETPESDAKLLQQIKPACPKVTGISRSVSREYNEIMVDTDEELTDLEILDVAKAIGGETTYIERFVKDILLS